MSADGTWQITVNTPMGAQATTLTLASDGATLTGEQSADGSSTPIYDGSVDGDAVSWKVAVGGHYDPGQERPYQEGPGRRG